MNRTENRTPTDTRAEYTAGLRAIADMLDANPDLPLPFEGTIGKISWVEQQDKGTVAELVRAIPGKLDKAPAGTEGDLFRFTGSVRGVNVEVLTLRSTACRRVVIGTRTVTEQVPDPSVPMVEQTREEEVVEWRCEPLLAEATS